MATPLKVFVFENYLRGQCSAKMKSILEMQDVWREAGIELVDKVKQADLILTNYMDCEMYAACRSKKKTCGVVICERFDACSLGESLQHYKNRQVIGVFSEFMHRDFPSVAGQTYRGRHHLWLLRRAQGLNTPADEKHRSVDAKFQHKLRAVPWNLWQYSHLTAKGDMARAQKLSKSLKTRDVFAVFHEHKEFPCIEAHRAEARRIVREGKWTSFTDACPKEVYLSQLAQSRVVVAPWGLGERIAADQFAIWAGCVLIKPRCDFVQTVPDLYADETYYVPCRPDWSDLAEVIDRVLSDYATYIARTQAAQQVFREWTQRKFTQHFCEELKDAYQQWKAK